MTQAFLKDMATKAAVAVAGFLVLGKSIAWWMTGSLSMQASLIDSLLDVGASFINFLAVRHAHKPADADHRFGHGKAEALASLGQSAFIAGSALFLMVDGVRRFFVPVTVQGNTFSNVIMVLSIVLTLFLLLFQRYVYQKTRSLAIRADSLHYQADFFTSLAVLVSLNASTALGIHSLDTMIGMGIACYIAVTSWSILKAALDVLMDKELEEPVLEEIRKIARENPKVLGIHDLRTRSAGYKWFIQMHLDLEAKLSLIEAHHIALEVSLALQEKYPEAEIMIHQDPLGHDEGDFHP